MTEVPVPALPVPEVVKNDGFLSGLSADNPYFQAGFGLMGLGVGLTALRQGIVLASTIVRHRFLVTLEISNKDVAYDWFLTLMAHHANPPAGTKPVLSLFRSHQLSVQTSLEERKNGSADALFKLVAGPGTHWFRYRGAFVQMERERQTRSASQPLTGTPWETLKLTTLSQDRHLFPQMLSEARDLALRGQEGKLIVHTPAGFEWKPFGKPRTKRPLSSVVLADGVGARIERDVKTFLDRRKWYHDRGIPYRRGYLLHGPPGSGKSSYIQALAGALDYDICILNLSDRGLGDDKLFYLLAHSPERSIILIEDIDAAFNKRVQTSDDGYQSSVTFSGFLNSLDGVASGEERLIFMTTNHIERLDPALIRPGRVDLCELMDDASPLQARTLFTRFYGRGAARGTDMAEATIPDDQLPADVKETGDIVEAIVQEELDKGRRLSMAALQGVFIRNGVKDAMRIIQGRSLFVQRGVA